METGRHAHGGHPGVVHARDAQSHDEATHRQAGPSQLLCARHEEPERRHSDRQHKGDQREPEIVADFYAGQSEREHCDEVHGPNAAAHGEGRRPKPRVA